MRRSPGERLRAAREKYTRAVVDLENAAIDFANSPARKPLAEYRDALIAAARKVTNATHEVGRAERAAGA